MGPDVPLQRDALSEALGAHVTLVLLLLGGGAVLYFTYSLTVNTLKRCSSEFDFSGSVSRTRAI